MDSSDDEVNAYGVHIYVTPVSHCEISGHVDVWVDVRRARHTARPLPEGFVNRLGHGRTHHRSALRAWTVAQVTYFRGRNIQNRGIPAP
jgi:hypothetical protein